MMPPIKGQVLIFYFPLDYATGGQIGDVVDYVE